VAIVGQTREDRSAPRRPAPRRTDHRLRQSDRPRHTEACYRFGWTACLSESRPQMRRRL